MPNIGCFDGANGSDKYTCAMFEWASTEKGRIVQVKQMLLEGNKRHMNSAWEFPNLDHSVQNEESQFMRPRAVILCGSDCRVVPNFIFDQGLGFLHVVQIGGPIASKSTLAAVDYAVLQKGVTVVVVLCTEDDPVMRASMDFGDHGENIATQSKCFYNTYSWAASEATPDLAEMNAMYVAYKCTHHSIAIGNRQKLGVLEVIPAVHNVHTGEVKFLPFWTPDQPKPFDVQSAIFCRKFLAEKDLPSWVKKMEHS